MAIGKYPYALAQFNQQTSDRSQVLVLHTSRPQHRTRQPLRDVRAELASCGQRGTNTVEMLVSVDHFNRARAHLFKSLGDFDTPCIINVARVFDALKQSVSNDRALINVERKTVSNQGCSIRCHDPSLPDHPAAVPWQFRGPAGMHLQPIPRVEPLYWRRP